MFLYRTCSPYVAGKFSLAKLPLPYALTEHTLISPERSSESPTLTCMQGYAQSVQSEPKSMDEFRLDAVP